MWQNLKCQTVQNWESTKIKSAIREISWILANRPMTDSEVSSAYEDLEILIKTLAERWIK